MHSSKVSSFNKTSPNLKKTLQLRYPDKTKELGLKNLLKIINRSTNGSYAGKKMLAGASRKSPDHVSSLATKYLRVFVTN